MTSITVSLSCAWLMAGGVAILTLIVGALWIHSSRSGERGFDCANCNGTLGSHIVSWLVAAAIFAVITGILTSFIVGGIQKRAERLEREAVQQKIFAQNDAEREEKRTKRRRIQRKKDQEQKTAEHKATKGMIDAIPVEWNPLRAALRTNKMRNAAKVELFTKDLGSMPKLSINQQWYIIETEFSCPQRARACREFREQLAKALVAYVDTTITDPLTEYESQQAELVRQREFASKLED